MAYLQPIAWMASWVPIFESGFVRAEIDNGGALRLSAADQPARLRSFGEARPYVAQDATPQPEMPARGVWSGLRPCDAGGHFTCRLGPSLSLLTSNFPSR